MSQSLIKLTYRFVIDSTAADAFSKEIMRLSYDEFKMKSQAYNTEGKFTTFSQMKANDGRANSLHYKCSFAVAGLVETLNKKIPVLNDESGRAVDFDMFSFEVIDSDINDASKHKVAVHFITGELKLIMQITDRLVLQKLTAEPDGGTGFTECITLKMQESLAVSGFMQTT